MTNLPLAAMTRPATDKPASPGTVRRLLGAFLRSAGLVGATVGPLPDPMPLQDPMLAAPADLPPAAAPVGPSRAAVNPARQGEGGGSLRILLAEDNRFNQRLALAMLTHAGHQVDLAVDGREAVAAAAANRYDVVLMDIHMPQLDGIGATQCIRALPGPACRTPIFAVTAGNDDPDSYLDAGMDDYFAKPIEWPGLFSRLAQIASGELVAA